MIEIVEVGAYKRDERNNVLTVQVKRLRADENGDQADLGYVRVWGPGGEAWVPVPGTQALYEENIGVFAFQTTVTAQLFGELKTGDKYVGAGEGARMFLKAETREVTMLVKTNDGKDAYATLSGTAEKWQVQMQSCAEEISANGANIMTPSAYLELQGTATLGANTVRLGMAPLNPVLTGLTGIAGIPSTSVLA